MNLIEHMRRMMAFSRTTFGPGARTKGVIDHIRKELVEIEENPDNGDRAEEWVDVVILGLDGLWRELEDQGYDQEDIPDVVAMRIGRKQTKNEARAWPDWRAMPADRAIEHVRSGDFVESA